MADYIRKSNKFLLRGMNVTLPGDRLGEEWAQVIRNLRCYRVGEWRQRPGLQAIADIDPGPGVVGSVLWISRINDISAGTFRRMAATTDGKVYVDNVGHTAFSLSDSGYSAEPYSSVIARPDRSPLPFLFLGNDARQGKFSTLGARTEWGLVAPAKAIEAELARNAYRTIDDFESAAGFTATLGVASLQTRVGAIGISQILYDVGTTGWASVAPATMDEQWQEGMFLTTSANVETIIVESIYQAIAPTTVAAIAYDSGATGACTIQLATPTAGLERNSMLRLNATENVRVLSVTLGLDDIPSLRCVTMGTISAGQAVDGFRSFRAYFANNHTTAETLSTSYVQLAVSGAGLASLSKTATLDLSSTDTGATRPIQEDDYIHVSIIVADFSLISELQLQFDIDGATNDFSQNYYFKSVRQPDLLAAVKQTGTSLTAQQQEIQRTQIDQFRRQQLEAERAGILALGPGGGIFPQIGEFRRARIDAINTELGGGLLVQSGQGAISTSGAAGSNQWTEIKVPIKEFQKVGSDTSRGWKDVKAFRVTVNATAAVNVGVDALWIGGGYGPDSSSALGGYTYIYRARNTQTGSRSNPSPPMRSPVLPQREAVVLTIPAGYGDAQADVFDIFRIGGSLGEYHFVSEVPSSSPTFTDALPDDQVVRNPIIEVDRFKPWPRPDKPRSGLCTVVGTRVVRTGGTDTFNTAWVRGTPILINNRAYSFYSNPESTTVLELNESAPNGVGLTFEIPEPLLDGQPLPFVFGPFGTGVSGEFILGLGDPTNPGYLYWTNGNDPESASDVNILEVCGPSEKLMAGTILDGIIYVWSDRRSWRILPSFQGGQSGGGSDFYAQETSMGKGLASRWALAAGDELYFLSYDGVWASKGDAIRSLTDESLAPLFRRDGSSTADTLISGELQQISFATADEKFLSLTYSRDGLYLTYKGMNGTFYALFHSFLTQGWMLDSFTTSVVTRYFKEAGGAGVDTILAGTQNGALYTMLATQLSDDGNFINCFLRTREEDWGDSRAQKQIADLMVDCDPAGQTVVLGALYDNGTSSSAISSATGASRIRFVRDLSLGVGDLKRSMALDISWLGINGVTKLYEWMPSALLKPESVFRRASDWENGGYNGPKWVQGIRITADTFNVAKDLTVQFDEAQTGASLSITHNGEVTKDYSWTPFVAHNLRLLGTDDDSWRLMQLEWIWEPEPPLATRWHTQYTSLDLPGYMHIREAMIPHRSTADITLQVLIDGVANSYSIAHSGGDRKRSYLPLKALKGKFHQFVLVSAAPFSLYLLDVEVRCGSWGRQDGYQIVKPFGDRSRTNGGAII